MQLYPSINAADQLDLAVAIDTVARSGADGLHVDIIDIENALYIPPVRQIIETCIIPIEIHLIVDDNHRYLKYLRQNVLNIQSYVERIIVHSNIMTQSYALDEVEAYDEVYLALNPAERPWTASPFWEKIDGITQMTVIPGRSGQTFISDAFVQIASEDFYNLPIEIDGGVCSFNIEYIREHDVDRVVCGSSFFNAVHKCKFVKEIKGDKE